jgi:hypothetical protein
MVKSTSIDSYYQHVIDGKARTQREKIYDCISQSSIPLTRRGISALTRIEINAVCGRVNSLIEAGLVQVALIARSGVTGKKVEYLEAMLPIAKQRKFDL